MSTKITAVEAKSYLTEVGLEWTAFWCHKGPVVKSMAEMSVVMQKMPEATYAHHVEGGKNDFASWVGDVLGDKELDGRLRKAKTVKTTAAAFAKRIKELEQCLATSPARAKKVKVKA